MNRDFSRCEQTFGSAAVKQLAFIAIRQMWGGLTLAIPMGDAASAIVMF